MNEWTLSEKTAGADHRAVSLHRGCVLVLIAFTPALPQEELDRGGALWWITTLKNPEELQNLGKVTKLRFSGFSYLGR